MDMSITLISVFVIGVILVWHFFNVFKLQLFNESRVIEAVKSGVINESRVIEAVKSGVSNSDLMCETAEKVLTLFYVFSSNKNRGDLNGEIVTILDALINKNFKLVPSALINIWSKLDNIELAQNKAKKTINTIC